MLRGLGITSLIVLLLSAAFLGFASGDLVRHLLDKHARQPAWKPTPGVAPAAAVLAALPLSGAVVPALIPVVSGAPPRLPFVPPRG
jgi:hypothetical protein